MNRVYQIVVVGLLLIAGGLFFKATTQTFTNPSQGGIQGVDASFYYYWLRSPLMDGDVDFENDLHLLDSMSDSHKTFFLEEEQRTDKGLLWSRYTVGWALFGAPFFLLADGLTALTGGTRDGVGPLYQAVVLGGQFLWAVWGIVLAVRICRRLFPDSPPVAALLMWAGSFVVFYQVYNLDMTHHLTFALAAWLVWKALDLHEEPERLRHWWITGLAAALMVLVRPSSGGILMIPFAVAVQHLLRQPAARIRPALLAGGVFLLALVIQLVAWKALYGAFVVDTYPTEKLRWAQPDWYASLWSPFHGLFYWNPILLLGVGGLVALAYQRRELVWIAAAVAMAFLGWTNAAWESPEFGHSFGNRGYDYLVVLCMVGAAWLQERWKASPRLLWGYLGVLAVLAGINLLLVIMTSRGIIPLGQPVTHAEMLSRSLEHIVDVIRN